MIVLRKQTLPTPLSDFYVSCCKWQITNLNENHKCLISVIFPQFLRSDDAPLKKESAKSSTHSLGKLIGSKITMC